MVTPGCCCWYLAKATAKNGASNVEPDPVRVGLSPPGPALAAATADAAVLVLVELVQAPTARRMIATAAAAMTGRVRWRGWRPGCAWCPDMVAPLLEDPERG
jgi:hypothetical protein